MVENLEPIQTFPISMNRTETLHAARYNIKDNLKNTPGQNDQVELYKKSKVLKKVSAFGPRSSHEEQSTLKYIAAMLWGFG